MTDCALDEKPNWRVEPPSGRWKLQDTGNGLVLLWIGRPADVTEAFDLVWPFVQVMRGLLAIRRGRSVWRGEDGYSPIDHGRVGRYREYYFCTLGDCGFWGVDPTTGQLHYYELLEPARIEPEVARALERRKRQCKPVMPAPRRKRPANLKGTATDLRR
jgi:hypothetical protein